ncbi:MAG: hypothetical protein AAF934_11555, partial [Bacteroidota bacterium]
LTVRCDDTPQNAAISGKSLETVLSEITRLGESEKKIITFDIVFNKHTNTYTYDNVRIIKESKKAIAFAKGADSSFKYMESSYQITCTDTEDHITVTNCPDYACVGMAVALCVESGGCAKVCKAKATYYPSAFQ